MRSAVVVSVGLIGVCLAAHAMPLCDYSSPRTDLSELVMSFAYQYRNDPYGTKQQDVNRGQFDVDYKRLFDTAEYGFDISLSNQLDISLLSASKYSTIADGNVKRYLVPDEDAFAFAGASARSSSSYPSLGMSVNLGLGLGRFADVTPFAIAVRIDEVLFSRESILKPLRDADLKLIAYEIEEREKYASTGDLLSALQGVIENSGFARPGGLDALDLAEIEDILSEQGFSRRCGWDGKIGLGYEILDPSGGTNDLLVTAAFNYAFTTAPNEQFLVSGSLSGPPTIFETNRVDLRAEYNLIVSEFLNVKATYVFARETWASVPVDTHRIGLDLLMTPLDEADVSLRVSLERRTYYLEWNVDVQLGLSIQLL